MTFKTLIAASALAAVIAAPAFAQPPQRSPEELAAAFDKADANKDGKLDFAEWKASLGDRAAQATDDMLKGFFDRRDADHDGKLTKAEFTAPMQRPAQ